MVSLKISHLITGIFFTSLVSVGATITFLKAGRVPDTPIVGSTETVRSTETPIVKTVESVKQKPKESFTAEIVQPGVTKEPALPANTSAIEIDEFVSADIPEGEFIYNRKLTPEEELILNDVRLMGDIPIVTEKLTEEELRELQNSPGLATERPLETIQLE